MSEAEQRLREILRRPLERVIAPRSQARLATISAAFDRTGKLRADAFGSSLLLTRDVVIAGAAAVGANVAPPARMPQAGRVVRVYADAKVAPSGGEWTANLYADGAFVTSVSIGSGETAGTSAVSLAGARLESGALLSWTVVAANGAADVSLCVVYRPT